MTAQNLLLPIIVPTLAGVLALFFRRKAEPLAGYLAIAATAFNLLVVAKLFGNDFVYNTPWGWPGFEFRIRIDHFSSFITLAAAGFGLAISLYSVAFMKGRNAINQFFSYFLITLGFVNGAVLADNLLVMLFFWEGLLLTLFGMIIIGHKGAYKTAIKAFTIAGITDLCMMLGIGLTIHLASTMTISAMHIPVGGLASLAFILMMIGAISKAGSMPFHSWIPDAAVDAPLPFMALVPAALEKLLGIYFLTRITLDIFVLDKTSWLSTLMMIVGSITILLAVLMALVQKDFKRLLSFHAISQVGYMILGIGSGVPAGIVGGIFHMINHAMYKSCLFLTGGAVEKQAGTTDLTKLGGIGKQMPMTFASFLVAAASISGVPPFNGFFSKELVYDGALERSVIFYAAAVLGSFFTAASFLKLGHAAFCDKRSQENEKVKEAPLAMVIPMVTIAGFCILFGLYNALPIQTLVQPVLGAARLEGHNFGGFHVSPMLVAGTLIALTAAVLNHLYGVKKAGSGLKAVDHIHYAPGIHPIYDKAEKGCFDPYNIGLAIVGAMARVSWWIDRGIDWIYNRLVVEVTALFTVGVRKLHNGSHATYLVWSFLGLLLALIYMFGGK